MKKTAKVERQFSLVVGRTLASTLGNQTTTSVVDPRTERQFSVSVIWEKQGVNGGTAYPMRVQIDAAPLSPMSANIIERRLGMTDTTDNYPITSTLMRRIPYEKIIDASRNALIEENFFSVANNIPLVHPLNETLLSKPKKGGRKFDRADSFYREIATRYMEAQSIGGSTARKPALYIAEFIQDEVKHLSDEYKSVQIRKWVAEARKRGYIPPVSRQQ
jgi:hypothetical protein